MSKFNEKDIFGVAIFVCIATTVIVSIGWILLMGTLQCKDTKTTELISKIKSGEIVWRGQ